MMLNACWQCRNLYLENIAEWCIEEGYRVCKGTAGLLDSKRDLKSGNAR